MRELRFATAAEMKAIDHEASERFRVPAVVLMERAGEAASRLALSMVRGAPSPRVWILVGKGNNGGDGLVVARLLAEWGARVRVVLLAREEELAGLSLEEWSCLQRCADVHVTGWPPEEAGLGAPDLAVDALLGTRLTGPARGPMAEAIQWMNALGCPILSLDVPSGMQADSGEVLGPCVHASKTVTFGLPKRCFVQEPAGELAGEVWVADIGFPTRAIRDLAAGMPRLMRLDVLQSWSPVRSSWCHKGDMGKVFVIAGSQGMSGAACLACQAALRAGAGMVRVGVPRSLAAMVASQAMEVLWDPLPEDAHGALSLEALEPIREGLEWCDVSILGPGLSRRDEVQQLVRLIVAEGQRPMVLDADGLAAWEGFQDHLSRHAGPLILTPHAGEFARLLDMDLYRVRAHRLRVVSDAARAWRASVVLKGAFTAMAGEDGRVFVNPTGNPGLATAGSGDVLAGALAGLWAQRLKQGMDDPLETACLGAFIHGWAADRASRTRSQAGLCAGDLLPHLGRVLEALALRRPSTPDPREMMRIQPLRDEEEWMLCDEEKSRHR